MIPTGLVLDPALHQTPLDVKAAVTKAVNDLVPLDKHVVVVAIGTPSGFRFAAAQRVGDHLQFFENVTWAHGSTGQPWSGEVGIVFSK